MTEETERVLGERRMSLLRDVGASAIAPAITETELLRRDREFAGQLEGPAVHAHLLCDDDGVRARLVVPDRYRRGSSGGCGHAGSLPRRRHVALAPRQCAADRRSDAARFRDLPTGPWQRPPTQAFVLPIAQRGQKRSAGIFVAGLNPFRPSTTGTRSFVDLLVGQIAAGLANVHAYEEERRRAEALAEIDRAKTTFFSNVSHEFARR